MLNDFIELNMMLSVLLLVVFIIRYPVLRYLGARWAYALWLIPLIRLALQGSHLEREAHQMMSVQADHQVYFPIITGSLDWTPGIQSVQYLLIGGVWILIAVSLLFIGVYRFYGFRVALERDGQLLTEEQHRLISGMADRNDLEKIRIRLVPDIQSPAIWDFFHIYLILPTNFFTAYSEQEQQWMMDHELIHLQRRDCWVNILLAMTCCLFWFNPFVHLAVRFIKQDQELSCDQLVLQGKKQFQIIEYGKLLIRMAKESVDDRKEMGYQLSSFFHSMFSKTIKERIHMLKFHTHNKNWLLGLLCMAVVLWISFTNAASKPMAKINFQLINQQNNEVLTEPEVMTLLGNKATISSGLAENNDAVDLEIEILPDFNIIHGLESQLVVKVKTDSTSNEFSFSSQGERDGYFLMNGNVGDYKLVYGIRLIDDSD